MLKGTTNVVRIIKSPYVGRDCIQGIIPYKDSITILNQDGILYHHYKDSSYYINKYLEDERRKKFWYYDRLIYHDGKPIKQGKINYISQLFDFDKQYIIITKNYIIESYVVRDNKEAISISTILPNFKKVIYKSREGLEKLFNKNNEDENIYYLTLDGGMYLTKPELPSENIILETLNEELEKHNNKEKQNSGFSNFIDQSINNFDDDKFNLKIPIGSETPLLIVRTNSEYITIQGIYVSYVSSDSYEVEIYDIPVNKYTLEQLKLFPKTNINKNSNKLFSLYPDISKEEYYEKRKEFEMLKNKEKIKTK